MGFLAQGVEIPLEQHQQVRMIGGAALAANGSEAKGIPFRVRWSKERPSDAFVAIEYNGYWFSVTNTTSRASGGSICSSTVSVCWRRNELPPHRR